MRSHHRLSVLALVMALVSLGVGGIVLSSLYRVGIQQERFRLSEDAQSQARLIEAVAADEAGESPEASPDRVLATTLEQVSFAHARFRGFGETGEFTLARLEGDQIVFLLGHRHLDLDDPAPISIESTLAEPQRRALSGESGTLIGLDYRGERVLAAYEPVAIPGQTLGIVAKIDLAEMRQHFLRAGLWGGLGGVVLILLGILLFSRIGQPMVQRLAESEGRYRAYVEHAPDAVFVVDGRGRYIDANEGAGLMLGLTREELLTLSIPEITAPESLEDSVQGFARLQERGALSMETTLLRKDGSPVPVSLDAVRLPGDRYMAFCSDITQRKRLEKDLRDSRDRLRRLTAHLAEVREEERRILARELHDKVGQDLTAMRMDLRMVTGESEGGRDTFAERLYSLIDIVDEAIERVNRISHELRSPILEFLGLQEAVRAHAEEIRERTGIEVALDLELGKPTGSMERDTALLRIFQEAMSNVSRHARANRVRVSLHVSGEGIVLEVQDDGVGVTKEQLQHPDSFGLVEMQERAVLMGGTVDVSAVPGGGTLVRAVVPLKSA